MHARRKSRGQFARRGDVDASGNRTGHEETDTSPRIALGDTLEEDIPHAG